MESRKIRLERLVAQNFRCFDLLDLRLGAKMGTPEDVHSGLTVIVAQNGQGKTAILDALRYLLGRFVARFEKIGAPLPRESDFRSFTFPREGKAKLAIGSDGGKTGEVAEIDLAEAKFEVQSNYMGLTGFLRTGKDPKSGDLPWVRWDMIRRKDKTENTKRIVEEQGMGLGSKFLWPYVDEYIISDCGRNPLVYPVIAYYGTDRRLARQKPGPISAMGKKDLRKNMYIGCLHAGLNYKRLVEWMFKLENKQLREAQERKDFDYVPLEKQTIELAMRRMLPNFSNLRTTTGSLNLQVDVEEDGAVNARLVDEQLSDGFKIVLTMVFDIVVRILEGNARLEGMTPERLLATPGIVLIDEIDLHLHPSWQQRIVPDLRRAFPNIQFVVTTHSPQVVSSVPKECLRIIDHGRVRAFSTQTEGVESQMILAQIFGVHAVAPENEWGRRLDRYAKLLTQGAENSEECVRLSEELDGHYGKQYPPLVRIRLLSKIKKHADEASNHA